MKRFDDFIMKPFFIHKYDKELIQKREEFMELFMKEGDVWEKMYTEEHYDVSVVEEARMQRGYSVMKHIEAQSIMKSALKLSALKNSNMMMSYNDPLSQSTSGKEVAYRSPYFKSNNQRAFSDSNIKPDM